MYRAWGLISSVPFVTMYNDGVCSEKTRNIQGTAKMNRYRENKQSADLKEKSVSIAKTITELTKINTWCYYNSNLIFFGSHYEYPEIAKDLPQPYIHELAEKKDPINCIRYHGILTFGIINMDPIYMVVGPVLENTVSAGSLKDLVKCFTADETEQEKFVENLSKCVTMSVYSFVPILLNVYQMLHFQDTRSTIEPDVDNFILTSDISFMEDSIDERITRKVKLSNFFNDIIIAGDVKGMYDWLQAYPDMLFCPEVLDDPLRNAKNSFLIGSTLASQSAIRGGMDMLHALHMHQNYIRKSENSTSEEEVTHLLRSSLIEYTEQVYKHKNSSVKTKLIADALRYIHQHLYSNLRTEDIAKNLYVSRGHLSTEFSREMGISISRYIRNEKINEAEKLLKMTDKSLSAISEELGFSSQSYFTKVFRKATGKTPNEFRKKK